MRYKNQKKSKKSPSKLKKYGRDTPSMVIDIAQGLYKTGT